MSRSLLLALVASSFIALAVASNSAASEAEFVYFVFSKDCFNKFFTLKQFDDVECLKLTLSKTLGFAMVVLSFAVKVPQMWNIFKAKSTAGIAPISFYLETVAFTSSSSYNFLQGFPFSACGEGYVILAQNIVLVLMMWYYNSAPISTIAPLVAVYAAIVGGMLNLPPTLQPLLVAFTVTMVLSARIPQIIKNFQNRSTGVLALGTVGMNFAGALARVFTTIQETNDVYVLGQFLVATSINAILFFQILAFWRNTNAQLSGGKQKKAN